MLVTMGDSHHSVKLTTKGRSLHYQHLSSSSSSPRLPPPSQRISNIRFKSKWQLNSWLSSSACSLLMALVFAVFLIIASLLPADGAEIPYGTRLNKIHKPANPYTVFENHQQRELEASASEPVGSTFRSGRSTSGVRTPTQESLDSQSTDVRPQYTFTVTANENDINHNYTAPASVTTTVRRLPQWASQKIDRHQQTNHQILYGFGKAPPTNYSGYYGGYPGRYREKSKLQDIQQQTQDQQQTQESSLQHYNCDSIIRDANFMIESPHYPASYPVNRICTYYIAKNRNDVCQVEITVSDMDIEDTPRCTADYLDLGGSQEERLCGLMLRNTRRIIMFPSNGSYIRVTFHSDSKNTRPYRGFSAELRQLPNTCYPIGALPPTYVQNGTVVPLPTYYNPYPAQTPQQVLHTVYGQRLYPITRPPYILRPIAPVIPGGGKDTRFGQPVGQIPGQYPYVPGQMPYIPSNQLPGLLPYDPTGGINRQPTSYNRSHTPIYLASYCDVYLSEMNGEIRSPGYPFGYPVNHSCIYTIKKATEDVCQLEMIFHHFDIQTANSKKDLNDNCYGDYLEMPDHSRLCGYYNQAMSRDHVLKKFYMFSDNSDYLFLQFMSDHQPTPDGSGFWIEVKQLPNTCASKYNTDNSVSSSSDKAKCDQLITGQFTTVERIYSPNFPKVYSPHQQCVYFIQPADESTCEFELDLVQFDLEKGKEQQTGNNVDVYCNKDFVQLPDRSRICGRTHFRRIFQFPKYHDRTSMFYFHTDGQIEDRGFEIVLRQLANSCRNTNNGTSNNFVPPLPAWPTGQTLPGNQNVYIPTVPYDPNNPRSLNPTPVFTYSNTTGFVPYNPTGRSFGDDSGSFGFGGTLLPGSGGKSIIVGSDGRKSAVIPNYLASQLPNLLNNPRNVDSTGTIPLYFSNGTLAARIPPLKPIDLIPFLKRGKTFAQKTTNGGVDGRNFYATLKNPGEASDIFANRLAESSGRPGNSEVEYESSSKLIQPRIGSIDSSSSSLLPSPLQLQPTYNCDQVITRKVEYIRSPNFPSNYPPVTRCIYSILKADTTVCQVRLQILSLDLEYTSGCKNDYFKIESTGEKLCGRQIQPETRVINYYGFSRDIRMIFNSDRQTTGSGFEIRVEQILNSCDGSNNITPAAAALRTSNSMERNSYSLITPRGSRDKAGRLIRTQTRNGDSPQAQALMVSNGIIPTQPNSSSQQLQSSNRICRTTVLLDTIFESENYPLPYPSNTDCLYKIFRSNRNVCRLEIQFLTFNVGNRITIDNSREFQDEIGIGTVGDCPNDYLEIDSVKYCGNLDGKKVAINFPRSMGEVSFRFVSISSDRFNGFRISAKQIDENCRNSGSLLSSASSARSIAGAAEDLLNEFSPATIESCSKISPDSDTSESNIIEEVIKIQSPKFGLASSLGYQPFLDCDYVIQKASREICALQFKFEKFSLEDSRSCSKDYLEINSLKLCGKMPIDTTRLFDFRTETMRLHFHTDAEQNDSGFAMIIQQIRC